MSEELTPEQREEFKNTIRAAMEEDAAQAQNVEQNIEESVEQTKQVEEQIEDAVEQAEPAEQVEEQVQIDEEYKKLKSVRSLLGKVTKEKNEATRQAYEQAQRLKVLEDLLSAQNVQIPQEQVPDINALVEQRVQERLIIDAFNAQATQVFQQGAKVYKDWNNTTKLLGEAGIINGTPNDSVLVAAMETGEAPAVLNFLAEDLEEASRIASLAPFKVAVEIAKIANKVKAKSFRVSQAPPPLKTLNGTVRTESSTLTDTDNLDEFVAQLKKGKLGKYM